MVKYYNNPLEYLVVYANADNKLLFRLRYTLPDYFINDITSMNWKVVDIQRFIPELGYFVSLNSYAILIKKYIKKNIIKQKRKDYFIELFYNIFH